jgi:hypothetical protein
MVDPGPLKFYPAAAPHSDGPGEELPVGALVEKAVE